MLQLCVALFVVLQGQPFVKLVQLVVFLVEFLVAHSNREAVLSNFRRFQHAKVFYLLDDVVREEVIRLLQLVWLDAPDKVAVAVFQLGRQLVHRVSKLVRLRLLFLHLILLHALVVILSFALLLPNIHNCLVIRGADAFNQLAADFVLIFCSKSGHVVAYLLR